MIITNNPNKIKINQKNYDKTFNNINLNSVSCDACGHNHWHIHGRYKRSFSFLHVSITIRIIRVICSHCGKTHAILMEGMIPFSSLLHSNIIRILISPSSDHVDSSHFYYLKNRFASIDFHSYSEILMIAARKIPFILLPT